MPLGRCEAEALWKGQLHGELLMLKTLVRQTEKVEAKLDQLAAADEQIARLLSIPGIGLRTAEMVKVMLDDPKRFRHARQVGSYSGLTPKQYESGLMQRNGKISKAGPALLRKLLIQVAWGMLRNNARGKDLFNRICKGHKTRRKLAAVAVGRHALIWCWGVLNRNQDWHWKPEG
jgi:transposase